MSTAYCDRNLPGLKRPCRAPLELTTDGRGTLVAVCHRCAWQHAGRCWRCGGSRTNHRTHGVYCDSCRDLARRESDRRAMNDADTRRRKNAANRKRMRASTEQRARKRETSRAWRTRNPDRVKAYKRKSAMNPTAHKRERERWWNTQPERAEKKRQQALEQYYQRRPLRPAPECRLCGGMIAYTPPGRPKVMCDSCVPISVARRRKSSRRQAVAA